MNEAQAERLIQALDELGSWGTEVTLSQKCDVTGYDIADSLGRMAVSMDRIAESLEKIQKD